MFSLDSFLSSRQYIGGSLGGGFSTTNSFFLKDTNSNKQPNITEFLKKYCLSCEQGSNDYYLILKDVNLTFTEKQKKRASFLKKQIDSILEIIESKPTITIESYEALVTDFLFFGFDEINRSEEKYDGTHTFGFGKEEKEKKNINIFDIKHMPMINLGTDYLLSNRNEKTDQLIRYMEKNLLDKGQRMVKNDILKEMKIINDYLFFLNIEKNPSQRFIRLTKNNLKRLVVQFYGINTICEEGLKQIQDGMKVQELLQLKLFEGNKLDSLCNIDDFRSKKLEYIKNVKKINLDIGVTQEKLVKLVKNRLFELLPFKIELRYVGLDLEETEIKDLSINKLDFSVELKFSYGRFSLTIIFPINFFYLLFNKEIKKGKYGIGLGFNLFSHINLSLIFMKNIIFFFLNLQSVFFSTYLANLT